MSNRFFISDTHFSHTNTWQKFKNSDGTPLRPFASTEEMDETMVENWNRVVHPNDTVYHLGDVAINLKKLSILQRLHGKKKLILGNHDIAKNKVYAQYFYELHAYRVFVDDFICSHIPLHPDCISSRFVCNIHGHLHGNRIMLDKGDVVDPRYFSVCVEQINYTPISYDDLKVAVKKQMDESNYAPPEGYFNGSAD